MKDKRFFDTKVLIYAIAEADRRAEVARQLLADGGGVVSMQVLNEFVAAAPRKYECRGMRFGRRLPISRFYVGTFAPNSAHA